MNEKIRNKRIDAINKMASYIYRYDTIYYQDENIKSWHKSRKSNLNFSKSIQYSAVGVILRRLKNNLLAPTVQKESYLLQGIGKTSIPLIIFIFHCHVI